MYLFVIYLIICFRWAIPSKNCWFIGLSVEDSVEKSDVNCLIIGLLWLYLWLLVLCYLNLYLCNLLPCSLWHTALYYSVYSPADLSFSQDREEGITLSGYIFYILPLINTPHLPLLYASFPATHFLFVQPFFRPVSNHIKVLSFLTPPFRVFEKIVLLVLQLLQTLKSNEHKRARKKPSACKYSFRILFFLPFSGLGASFCKKKVELVLP